MTATPRPAADYLIIMKDITWYAVRGDGSRVITAGADPERLHAAIRTDRRHRARPRIPLTQPAA